MAIKATHPMLREAIRWAKGQPMWSRDDCMLAILAEAAEQTLPKEEVDPMSSAGLQHRLTVLETRTDLMSRRLAVLEVK